MHNLKRLITLHNDNIIFYIFSNINTPTCFQHQTPYFNQLQNQTYFHTTFLFNFQLHYKI